MDIIEQLRERHGMGAGAERGGAGRSGAEWDGIDVVGSVPFLI